MHNNVNLGPVRSFIAATAIGKGLLCKYTSAADTVTPCTAQTDAALFVSEDAVDSGARGNFRAFTAFQEHRVLISANVTRGAKLMLDASNPGQLLTRTTGVGVAVAAESGSTGGYLLVEPCFTET